MTDAYRGLVGRSGKSLPRDRILETHARYEAHQEAKTPGFIAVTDSKALAQRSRRGPCHATIFNLQAWQK
jgi:hypothetical protein